MSSTVLARKYRPRNFETLVGQAHVVQALANALTQQRLHHAYLFTGTRGVGKTTIARILAKSLNCTGPDGSGGITAEPCGACAACRDIDAGRFIDYVELDAASNRGVDEITRLLDQAVYKPVVGRFKVYLIDEVHMLSTTAFNAMLKTLEEPPGYLKFILATTDPQKVPPTVLSRCLQFNLRPMAPETIVRHLAAILASEDVAAEPGALKLIARAARGSMRDAQSLADQAIAYGSGRIEEAAVRQMLGAVDRGHAARCIEAAAARDGAALIAAVDGLRELGLSAAGALEEMAALLQEMAIVQAVPGALAEDDPDAEVARRLAPLLPADETQLLYSMVLAGRAEIALAPDEYSGLVMVLLRMLAFAPADARSASTAPPTPVAAPAPASRATASTAAPMAMPASVATPASAVMAASVVTPVRAPAVAPAMPAAATSSAGPSDDPTAPAIDGRPAADLWTAVVQRLAAAGAISAMVRELAMQAECLRVVDGTAGRVWHLRVERENLRTPALRERLQAALAQAEGRGERLEVEAGAVADTPAARDAAERDRRQAEAERVIQDDPLVKALMAQYKTARIVPGSVRPPPGPTP
ncbi:MAG TPA: DNA polymerase III subunit gamma/tau [Caldimonas sp.]|nr:DNA polymerase III subunit gamma/tau [Caldimonas sp.]